ncbi:hypothetical protein VTI74DRAFT_5282 [Chaetomium olivicolor]
MARVQSPPILSQVRVARSYSEQASALRALKDEVVGHVQRKEWWIQNGILESLVKILQDSVRSSSGLNGKERSLQGQSEGLSEEEAVKLLALQLIASFSYGGAAFLGPLHAAGVVPTILPAISPADNHPKIVLNALRTLRNIAESAQFAPPGLDDVSGLADALFASPYLDYLCAILSQDSTEAAVQAQKHVVTSLISRLCRGPQRQNALADSGILDALATMLASFIVERGEVVPGAEIVGRVDGLADLIPPPAPRGADLASVLEAVSTIIADSRFRSCLLLSSPAVMAVMPSIDFAPISTESRTAWTALEMNGLSSIRARNPGAMDYLLPAVPVPHARSKRADDYPPLGFSLSRENLASAAPSSTFRFTGWDPSRLDAPAEDEDAEEPESPLIPWLIHLARSTYGLERVMAASVLTSLFKAGFANPEREHALAVLIVPLLCELMKENDKEIPSTVQQAGSVEPDMAKRWAIMERTPEVLARLVGDSKILQQAAYDCGAIKMAAKLLKDSYEPQPVQCAPRPWSPTPDRGAEPEEGLPTCRVGPPGHVPAYVHKIRMRESALKLVAAMATLENSYREALVAEDVAPYIIESLSPRPRKPKNAKEKSKTEKDAEDGPSGLSPYGHNPNAVIIEACHAVRTLSRLPKILRTTLQDHGVAVPINDLLKHHDADVQVAASSVTVNLVSESSPMVEGLLKADIIKTLCKQAHSLSPGLRLNAMWALKHLMMSLDTHLRKQCLEELSPGWLVQLMSDDTLDEDTLRTARRTITDPDDDEDMDSETHTATPTDLTSDTHHLPWTWPALSRLPSAGPLSSSERLHQASLKLSLLRDAELNPTRKARADTLAIQEQALGFIRNLVMLPAPAPQTDMVDYLFTELGQDRLFGLLADKLKVRVVNAFARRNSRGRDTLVLYPQPRIVENLVYILVHIAAGVPRHRQLVVAQTELLKLLGAHVQSRDVGVRKALAQLFENLSWMENEADKGAWSQRTGELERLGFLAKLEGLEQADEDLDVRQRAKAAVAQLKGGVGSG